MKQISPISFALLAILCTAIAQIVLKISSASEIMSRKWLLLLMVSLSSYVISFVSYYLALKYFDLSKIAPITMVSTVSIVALYGFLAGETFSFIRFSGIMMSIISIIFIYHS